MNRGLQVGIAIVLTATAAGFFSGIRATSTSLVPSPAGSASGVATARGYADERLHRYGPNANMYNGAVAKLGVPPDINTPVIRTDAEHAAALAKRASRRAYEGAPPTVPHQVLQMGPLDCVSCHATGAKIGIAIAPKLSHPVYQSCTQCHVVMNDPLPSAPPVAKPENTFEGISSWGKGSRAWVGAPPTIPHPTLMRPDCASCHGVFGAQGIKSTHPWRLNCQQCHVANAANDQFPGAP